MSRAAVANTIELPPLCVRADVGSVDPERRTVDLVFSTGAAVERTDYWTGKRYIEKLSMDPKAVKLERLNAGGPLLDAHSSWSIQDQIGVVEPGTAKVVKGEARATVRFSARDAVEAIWQDVRDKIIRSVSVGYRILRFEEEQGKDGALPIRTATLWEPYEISLVPMPADFGAGMRNAAVQMNPCELVMRQVDAGPRVTDADRTRRFQLAKARGHI